MLVVAWVTHCQAADRKKPETADTRFQNFYSAGNYDAALVEAQKLATAAQGRFGASSVNYAGALNRVANVYYAQHHYDDAAELRILPRSRPSPPWF